MLTPMPGRSHSGPLPPLSASEARRASELRRLVDVLAGEIGERSVARPQGLTAAARFIGGELKKAGLAPETQRYEAAGVKVDNVIAEIPGGAARGEIVIVGAHYDAVPGTVGADDNASGVAATLVLAGAFARSRPARTLRFAFFANEEMPHFQTEAMGSLVYARRCRARGETVVAMLSLESLGCYSDAEGSQRYPGALAPLFPSRGNFVGFASDLRSAPLLGEVVGAFRAGARFPSQGAALPADVPGVGWSDHWAFWQVGYPAVMVTDTAPFRNPHYHQRTDRPETLDYESLGRVVTGLEDVMRTLGR